LVDSIDAVNLSDAYVSIEKEKVNELVQFLKEHDIQSVVTEWNHPESLYVGEDKTKKDLVVLAIHW
jgi:ribosomal protein L12E/L44/L45/RPP1/RPP2